MRLNVSQQKGKLKLIKQKIRRTGDDWKEDSKCFWGEQEFHPYLKKKKWKKNLIIWINGE